MKKRYVFMMCVIAVVLLSICVLVACDPGDQKDKTEADYEWIEIATADELVGMKSDACYKLTADLNLNGAQWQPHSVIGFDGGGHTIKNATIIGNGAFLNSCNWLKNCTFDNFKTVCGGDLDKMATACLSAKNSVENITVKNCTANIKGSSNGYFAFVVLNRNSVCKVKNCRVKDCVVETVNTVSVGGISYESNDTENCVVERMTVKNSADVAGIAVFGSCENCIVKDCEFESTGKDERGNYVAGVIASGGNSSYMKGCTSQGNIITFTSSRECIAGGLGGTFIGDITDCVSRGNTIRVKTDAKSYIGGFVGSHSGKVRNGFAFENYLRSYNEKDITAGFIAKYTGTANSDTFCGVYMNVSISKNGFSFSPKNQGITYCYSTYEQIKEESDNVEYLPQEDWFNADTIKQTFHLPEEKWLLKDGALPELKYNF